MELEPSLNVLAFNCGSSSLRFQLTRVTDDGAQNQTCLERGHVERITDYGRAVQTLIDSLRKRGLVADDGELAVGHRIVHGGAHFVDPVRIDARVLAAIAELEELVPLHNGPALRAIEAARAAFSPRVPAVAVFDTCFHKDLPACAAEFPLPAELARKHGIRRAGFHGLAHRWMSERHAALTSADGRGTAKIVTLQLGHGCSVAAIANGRSIDVSMGFSPLEGLMMGTRSGDVDPALVAYLARHEKISAEQVTALLNEHSGLLGVSGRSADMRDLIAAERDGDAQSALAVEMFVQRVRKSIAAHIAVLGGARAIVFGGGMGENSAEIRRRICSGFEWCGLVLDRERNERAAGEVRISAEGATLECWVIPVDEECLITRDTFACLRITGPS